MLKKFLYYTCFCLAFLILTALISCEGRRDNRDNEQTRLKILASFFPMEQFVLNIVEDVPGIEVDALLPESFGCPHDYYLNPGDMKSISTADVLVINGLGMENISFTELTNLNLDLKIIDASSEIKIAMEAEEHHGQSEECVHHDHHHGGVNPHIFSSPRHAALQVKKIAGELSAIDSGYSELYLRNAEFYAGILDSLGAEFRKVVWNCNNKKIVTVHEVFDYLAEDTGLEIVGTIESSPGQEPSAGEMLELVSAIKEVNPSAIFIEPQYPASAAEAIAKEAGVPVYILDPVASGPEDAGPDYYVNTMIKNLDTLQKALNN